MPAPTTQTCFGARYHAPVDRRSFVEVEAKSIAFVVTTVAGLGSGDYTVPYVADWANGDVDLLKPSPAAW